MIKVYQKTIDPKIGDCMQAVFASLFEMELDDVPKFIECECWFGEILKFLKSNGYTNINWIDNKNYSRLNKPTHECFKKEKWYMPAIMTPKKLHKYTGVNGYFFASVLSPKFFKLNDPSTHAVVIDQDYNIVHDPNPAYQEILKYPLTSLLDYNGIIDVLVLNKK